MKHMKRSIFTLLILLIPAMSFAGAWIADAALDALLSHVETNSVRLHIVSDSTTPTDVTNTLGNVTIDGDDMALADDTSGRKLTITAQNITASGTGTARHWVLCNAAGDTLYAVGTATSKSLTETYVYEFAAADLISVGDAE